MSSPVRRPPRPCWRAAPPGRRGVGARLGRACGGGARRRPDPGRDGRPTPSASCRVSRRTWAGDELAEGCLAIQAGALWVATNVDPTLPTERGLLPGNGSLVAALRRATGADPEVAGKPQATDVPGRYRAHREPTAADGRGPAGQRHRRGERERASRACSCSPGYPTPEPCSTRPPGTDRTTSPPTSSGLAGEPGASCARVRSPAGRSPATRPTRPTRPTRTSRPSYCTPRPGGQRARPDRSVASAVRRALVRRP